MKVVILAGGSGTRLMEETNRIPKPMVEIGHKPIIWHIMKYFSHFGHHDFVICLGYKGYALKEYFQNYFIHNSDVTLDIKNQKMTVHRNESEPWSVTLVETGASTMTGGRLKRIRNYLGNESFMMTYGDGLSDVNLDELLKFHKKHGHLATVTAVNPPGRFGVLEIENGRVEAMREKPPSGDAWINGGFFVLDPSVTEFISGDMTSWEREPMQDLAKKGHLQAYCHDGFWQPMDTLREREYLEGLWNSGKAPWKIWT